MKNLRDIFSTIFGFVAVFWRNYTRILEGNFRKTVRDFIGDLCFFVVNSWTVVLKK